MCIVIDTNTWSSVIDSSSTDHSEFKPVYDWIFGEGSKGKIVYRGTTYLNETPAKYRKLLKYCADIGKAKGVSLDEVDFIESELKQKIQHRDFDDPHIVAIIIASKCKLICTNEQRAIPFFKDKDRILYPKRFNIPKIYHNASNKDLLTDKNISKFCLPTLKTSKTKSNDMSQSILNIIQNK
jgi:predicted nucleic acid-binding protein